MDQKHKGTGDIVGGDKLKQTIVVNNYGGIIVVIVILMLLVGGIIIIKSNKNSISDNSQIRQNDLTEVRQMSSLKDKNDREVRSINEEDNIDAESEKKMNENSAKNKVSLNYLPIILLLLLFGIPIAIVAIKDYYEKLKRRKIYINEFTRKRDISKYNYFEKIATVYKRYGYSRLSYYKYILSEIKYEELVYLTRLRKGRDRAEQRLMNRIQELKELGAICISDNEVKVNNLFISELGTIDGHLRRFKDEI